MRKFEGEPTPETTKHVTQVNGENVLEDSSTKAGTPHFTRRNFLKAMIVGGGAAAASYAVGKSGLTLRQESDTAEKNKPEYDFIPLVEDLKPVEEKQDSLDELTLEIEDSELVSLINKRIQVAKADYDDLERIGNQNENYWLGS